MRRVLALAMFPAIAACVLFFCSGCSQSLSEKALPEDAFVIQGGERYGLWLGDIRVNFDMPEYELEVKTDAGKLWTWTEEMGMEKFSASYDQLDIEGAKNNFFTVCGSVDQDSGKDSRQWAHIEDDNVTVRVIIRKEGKPVGYALLAAWDNNGAYFNEKCVVKAVTFVDKDGAQVSVSEKQVNKYIDNAIEEFIVKADLFSTKGYSHDADAK